MFLDIIQPTPLVLLHLAILLATHFIRYHSPEQESVHTLTNACHQAPRCLVNLIYIIDRFNFHVWCLDLYAGSPGAADPSPPHFVHSRQPFRPSSAQFPMMGIIIIIVMCLVCEVCT